MLSCPQQDIAVCDDAGGRRQSPSDAGTTMVELLVGMIMSAVVGSMVILFMTSTLDGTRQAQGENEQASAARVVLQSWSTLLRLATSTTGSTALGTTRFLSLSPVEAKFCAALGSKGADPDAALVLRGIDLKLDAGRLVELRWASCAGMLSGASADTTRILAPRVAQLPNVWLVTPYAATDLPLGTTLNTGLLTTSLTSGTSAVSPDNLLRIAAVQIAFQTQPDPVNPAAAGTYSTVITLPIGT